MEMRADNRDVANGFQQPRIDVTGAAGYEPQPLQAGQVRHGVRG